jgi:very-short-patch-repair endonuclease
VFERRPLEKALDEAAYLRLYDGIACGRVIEDHPERSGRLKACIEEHVIGTTRANDGLEERFFLLCRRHGLPDPLVHQPIGPYEVDFLWREQRVIVETDDRASHLRAASFERDHRKTAYLQDLGYDVRRVTSRMLKADEAGVMDAIKRRVEEGVSSLSSSG